MCHHKVAVFIDGRHERAGHSRKRVFKDQGSNEGLVGILVEERAHGVVVCLGAVRRPIRAGKVVA